MSINYKRNCDNCGEYYSGWGRYFCSMSCANKEKLKGKTISEEHKLNLSESRIRRKELLGYLNSPETRLKMSLAKTGTHRSDETKRKISNGNLGKTLSVNTRNLLRLANLGKKHSIETKIKISEYVASHPIRYWSGKKRPDISGENSYKWKGGVTPKNLVIRHSLECKNWRKSVFERDNHTCQICGQVGGYLEADHIKLFSMFPELRFDIDNGQTLCKECHRLKTKVDLQKNWSNQYIKKEVSYV